jgi:hypothetical protein
MKIDIEQFRKLMHHVSALKGDFHLFGLFIPEDAELHDRWDLVISAPWLDSKHFEALREFTEYLSSIVSLDQRMSLSMVVNIDTDDPRLDTILKTFDIDDGAVLVKDEEFFDMDMKRAYILRATKPQMSPVTA